MNPFEPTADSRVAAKKLWDLYSAFTAAGFTSDQAMDLIIALATNQ